MKIYSETLRSPNFGYPKGATGRNGQKIVGVGVHISGAEWESNRSWILNPSANASYNALIKRDGDIVQFVAEENAAYSHGRVNNSSWPLLKSGVNPNLYTLSVARVGSNQNTWTAEQMDSTVKLILHWADKYNFKPEWPYVFGHKHIDSVGRWFCPGDPFLNELNKRLSEAVAPPSDYTQYPIPEIQRTIGVEVGGQKTREVAYLINNATYVRAAFVMPLAGFTVVGHGDHIKIS